MSKTAAGRKLFSLRESYIIAYLAFRSMPKLRHARKNNFLSQQFIERIMIAVTEVNGCAVCSYAHTKMALEAGMSNDEIQKMLGGSMEGVPPDEMPAVLFAQHYAEYRGRPSGEAWNRVAKVYGLPKANGILGAVRIIMMGNATGIPFSSFFNRFKGKPDTRSSLPYELGMVVGSLVFIPVAMVHALGAILLKDVIFKEKGKEVFHKA